MCCDCPAWRSWNKVRSSPPRASRERAMGARSGGPVARPSLTGRNACVQGEPIPGTTASRSARRALRTQSNHGDQLMRIGLILAGIILAAVGFAAFTGNLNFNQDKEVVNIGGLSASVKQEKTVPQWLGGLGVLVG